MSMHDLERRIARLEAKVNQMIRVGTVTTLFPDKGKARVTLGDADGLLSHELPVLFPKTHADKHYHMPDVGEHVLCVFLPLGLEQGFILGAFYSTADPVQVADPNKHHIRFKDGTFIEYDRKSGCLTVDCVNRVIIKAPKIDFN